MWLLDVSLYVRKSDGLTCERFVDSGFRSSHVCVGRDSQESGVGLDL